MFIKGCDALQIQIITGAIFRKIREFEVDGEMKYLRKEKTIYLTTIYHFHPLHNT